MFVLFKIALRNLRQHRSKTLIIGIIIAVGVFILIIGNSLMDTADSGIKKAFIENFTGDVMITGKAKGKISLFGVQSPGGIEETPIIPNFDKIKAYSEAHKNVETATSQITGVSIIKVKDQPDPEKRAFTFLIGIEPDSYHKIFTTSTIIEGTYLKPGQKGIIISQDNRKTIEENLGKKVNIGDSLVLTSIFSNRGPKIRNVPVVGIFNLEQFKDGIEMLSYIDSQSLRALKGMTVGNLNEVDLSDTDTALLDFSLDDLGSDDMTTMDSGFGDDSGILDMDALFSDDSFTFDTSEPLDSFENAEENIFNVLAISDEEKVQISEAKKIDSGAWEYIILKMSSHSKAASFIKDINLWFQEEGIEAQAGNWKKAAGPFATMADVVRIVFNIVVLLVVVVAVLIVINTLVISVIERTAEIGTMRALGAQKGFIRNLFNLEIVIIVFIFGGIGILAGLGALGITALAGIKATNSVLEILFAGPVLIPVVNIKNILITFGTVFLVGLVANLYPLAVALKIQPIEAMREN